MEEHKLQMFVTKELKRIYDPTEDEVSEQLLILHTDKVVFRL
jgi:hypothetical protein